MALFNSASDGNVLSPTGPSSLHVPGPDYWPSNTFRRVVIVAAVIYVGMATHGDRPTLWHCPQHRVPSFATQLRRRLTWLGIQARILASPADTTVWIRREGPAVADFRIVVLVDSSIGRVVAQLERSTSNQPASIFEQRVVTAKDVSRRRTRVDKSTCGTVEYARVIDGGQIVALFEEVRLF
jgi:hypothetical protein